MDSCGNQIECGDQAAPRMMSTNLTASKYSRLLQLVKNGGSKDSRNEGKLVKESGCKSYREEQQLEEGFNYPVNDSAAFEDDWPSDDELEDTIVGCVSKENQYDILSNCSDTSSTISGEKNVNLNWSYSIKGKIQILHARLKVNQLAGYLSGEGKEEERDACLRLEKHLLCLMTRTSPISSEYLTDLLQDVQDDSKISSVFLLHLTQFITSHIDLNESIIEIISFLDFVLPCVEASVKNVVPQNILIDIRNQNIVQLLYEEAAKQCREEIKFSDISKEIILHNTQNSKCHLRRMCADKSQVLFKETFGDVGNLTDMYTIYIWHIVNIWEELQDDSATKLSSVVKKLENSGKFITIHPTREPQNELSHPPKKERRSECKRTNFSDPNSQYVDLRVVQLYHNGVMFLANMADWKGYLWSISEAVHNLVVKKQVNFTPSLGTIFALPVKDEVQLCDAIEGVSYIRVRVVHVCEPVCRVYGIDTGSAHTCCISNLIQLPVAILSPPPAGRLALLPVVPSPSVTTLVPTLRLLLALIKLPEFVFDLAAVNIRDMEKWTLCQDLVPLTLQLLQSVVDITHDVEKLCNICALVTDYLERMLYTNISSRNRFDEKDIQILNSSMQVSSRIRFFVASLGSFTGQH